MGSVQEFPLTLRFKRHYYFLTTIVEAFFEEDAELEMVMF